MSKLRAVAVMSNIFANTTWAASNVYRICRNTTVKAVDAIKGKHKYDIEIFKGEEQLEVKEKLSRQQMLDVINTMQVFPDIIIILKVHNYKGYTILNV